MNLPNKITLARLGVAVALFVLLAAFRSGLASHGPWGWLAFALFVLSSATDWVDGFVARRFGLVTALGRILDPFVDKVLAVGTLIFLCAQHPHLIPPWVVVVILGREFFVSSLRGFLESRGVAFGAELPGKIKMVLQSLLAGTVLFWQALFEGPDADPGWIRWLSDALLWSTLAVTLLSGWLYARNAWQAIGDERGTGGTST